MVIGVDPTFNLGDFYAPFTSYRHPALANKDGVNPLFLGPTLVHQRKLFSTYKHLPHALSCIDPMTKYVKAFGTDGESNLYSALNHEWTEADHLLCSIHFKRNIERKLSELGIGGSPAQQYVQEILGNDATKGLIDSESGSEFEALLASLELIWKERELPFVRANKEPVFYDWFLTEKVRFSVLY